MLSAMMVVYGFVSGGPGARALQLTTPSFHSLHNDSSEYSSSRASRGCGNNLGCHLETRVAMESILYESVEPESIDPVISPRRQAAWRMQFVPYRAEALIVEHAEQHVSPLGQSETPCVFHRRVDDRFKLARIFALSSQMVEGPAPADVQAPAAPAAVAAPLARQTPGTHAPCSCDSRRGRVCS